MTNEELDQLDKLMAEGPMGGIKTLEDANKAGSQERPFVTEDCDGVLWLVVSLMRDAVRWQPSRLIQQAMMVLEKLIDRTVGIDKVTVRWQPNYWTVDIWRPRHGVFPGKGDELKEATCLAVKAAWEEGGEADD